MSLVNQYLSSDASVFTPAGTSFIDVTVARDCVETAGWHYVDIPSASDHPYIMFHILPKIAASRSRPPNIPSGSRLDKSAFVNAICDDNDLF